MQCPSKFIANSDFASTPSTLLAPKELTFTPTVPFNLTAGTVQTFNVDASFQDYFDSFFSYITVDGGNEISLNGTVYFTETFSGVSVQTYAQVIMTNARTVSLKLSYFSYNNTTVTGTHTFRAIVTPMLSPYQPD